MDIKGVEIFATGRWNDVKTFTEADLDSMAEAFDELSLSGRLPLKLGHNPEQPMTDGQPALGWVSRVWRDGSRLLADFTQMPRVVYEAVKAGLYKFISVEMYRDAVANGKEYPFLLSAVALLGADIPAVSGLKELQALAMSRRAVFRSGALVTFTRDVSNTGGRKTMADEKDKVELSALTARVDALTGKLETFSTENATLKADNKRLKDEAEAREKAIKKDKVTVQRAAIGLRFKTAIDGRLILPSTQERFERDPAFKSDDGVLEIKLDSVDSFIKENHVPGAKALPAGGGGGIDSRGGDSLESEEALANADGTLKKGIEDLRATNLEFTKAPWGVCQQHLLRKHPKLAEAYRSQPGIKGGAHA